MQSLPLETARELETLCELFDGELERQVQVLAVVRAQGDAARAQDVDSLHARTAALTILMHESLLSERRRINLLPGIARHFELVAGEETLSALIRAVPEPWRRRMEEFQVEIRKVLDLTQQTIRTNAVFIRGALRRSESALSAVSGEPGASAGVYDADGGGVRVPRDASLLNAVG